MAIWVWRVGPVRRPEKKYETGQESDASIVTRSSNCFSLAASIVADLQTQWFIDFLLSLLPPSHRHDKLVPPEQQGSRHQTRSSNFFSLVGSIVAARRRSGLSIFFSFCCLDRTTVTSWCLHRTRTGDDGAGLQLAISLVDAMFLSLADT